jgi:hypothetical protein
MLEAPVSNEPESSGCDFFVAVEHVVPEDDFEVRMVIVGEKFLTSDVRELIHISRDTVHRTMEDRLDGDLASQHIGSGTT